MDFSGHTEVDSSTYGVPATYSSASVNYPFPLEAVGGISYRPTDQWNFEFDAQYSDWSELGNLTIQQSSVLPLLPYGHSIPLDLDWESSWYFEWGATRYFDNGWHVSAGYIFNENSVPDNHYSPLVSDLDRHFFSLGTGYKGEHFNFDVAYQLGYAPDRTVTDSPTPVGYPAGYHPADGVYSFLSHAIMLSVGWHFQ
jgi:long-chain fatty acid transport protein